MATDSPTPPGRSNGNGGAQANAHAAREAMAASVGPTPPQPVLELAAAGVRFVAASVQIEPDFSRDTLPLVDHYLAEAERAVRERPESLPLVAQAVGVYFGEVVRRTYPCWWRIDRPEPIEWRLEFRDVYFAFHPVEMAYAALLHQEQDLDDEGAPEPPEPTFVLAEEDREAVAERLEDMPPVGEQDYYRLSTRLEAVDVVVEALRSVLYRHPERQRVYRPADYLARET